ncbi:alkaline phosphatase synthesis transcriptional regulatory protein PhoP [bacterium BMS3Abin14]|nr:alkaline phosphatase synthesis transcriptional regulatory protein PhoP [bacterium BMS3Abin14]
MEKKRILVIEDDEDIAELIEYNLVREGFVVKVARSGEEGLSLASSSRPDIVLLDLMLPGVDGLEVRRRLLADQFTRSIPVVMVTAKRDETDVVVGLELGADDYIVKPFSPKVLVARVKAILRRSNAWSGDDGAPVIERGCLAIHPGRREVVSSGVSVPVTFTEFNILLFLARRPGWVFTRSQIVDAVKGDDYAVTERSVDVHVFSLRKKLGNVGGQIETVRGVGYRFKE